MMRGSLVSRLIWLLASAMAGLWLLGSVPSGLLTVFFDVAYQSYLPSLVGRQHLLEGNAKLAGSANTPRRASSPSVATVA